MRGEGRFKLNIILPSFGLLFISIIFIFLVISVSNEFYRAGVYESSLKNQATKLEKINIQAESGIDLAVTITDNEEFVEASQILNYKITIDNFGSVKAKNVYLSFNIPSYTTIALDSSTAGWVCQTSVCNFQIESIDSLFSQSVTISVLTSSSFNPTTQELIAFVIIRESENLDTNLSNNEATDINTIRAYPQIKLTQTTTENHFVEGGTVVYRFDYTNDGLRDAQNVVVTERLPIFTTFNFADSTNGWTCSDHDLSGNLCSFTIPYISAKTSGILYFSIRINATPASLQPISQIVNSVSINNGDGIKDDINYPAISPADLVTNIASPELGIVKEFLPLSAGPNDIVRIKVTLQNTGNANSYEVTLRDNSLVGSKFSNLTADLIPNNFDAQISNIDGNEVILFISKMNTFIAPGETVVFEYSVVLKNHYNNGESYVSYSSVTGSSLEGDIPGKRVYGPISAFATLNLGKPDLAVSISNNLEIVKPGKPTTYSIVVTNNGHIDTKNITISVTIPEYSIHNPSPNPNWHCSGTSSGSICLINIGSLGSGETVTILFGLRISFPIPNNVTVFAVSASVTYDGSHGEDYDLSNNVSTDSDKIAIIYYP